MGGRSQWVDVYFTGRNRYTLWNNEIITTQVAMEDAFHSSAFDTVWGQLSLPVQERESKIETKAILRTSPKQMRMHEWVRLPEIQYPQFEDRTFQKECDRLEAESRKALPSPVAESFKLDRSHAYGIGLHAIVAETNLNRAAIERTIQRFREVGECEGAAPMSVA